MTETKVVASGSQARQLIDQKAVEFNGKPVEDINFRITREGILQVGKRRFVQVVKT
jgi:tyrosyl-tRNA synthetase